MRFRWIAYILAMCVVATACAATPVISPSQQVASGVAPDVVPEAEAALAAPVLSRQQAVELLMEESFLPAETAGCVIDAVFAQSGMYNPNSAEAMATVDQAAVVQACTTGDQEQDEDGPSALSFTPVEEEPVDRAAPFELTDDTMPAINPGGRAVGSVKIGRKTIDYVTITPPGFTIRQPAPVFFALPPGGQNLDITRDVADVVYLNQAVQRGWVVVSPASPGGVWFEEDNTEVIPELMSWIRAWVAVEGDKVHLGGMSNGGLSAFHIAAHAPDEFHSLLVYPGFPRNDSDREALPTLADMPIRMWVGGLDDSWITPMEAAAAELRTFGADVELWVLPNEPHVLQSTADGAAFFAQLEAVRTS